MSKTIILAGNYKQYTDWIYDNVLPDVEKVKDYVYGNSFEKIMGTRAKEVIVIGTFFEDVKNAGEVYDNAKLRVYQLIT